MAIHKLRPAEDLTFVSMTGPTLDHANSKTMRAHTTRANFRKRRHRLVQEYSEQKSHVLKPTVAELNIGSPLPKQPNLAHRVPSQATLSSDAELIDYLTQEMKKLYPYTADGEIDDQSTRMHSHWVALLSDATMLDVSLYFATQVYTARLRHHAEQFLVAAAKSNAFHSLRKRLSDVSDGCPDTLVASILTLTILDQSLGDIKGWKIHISGLLQVVTLRSWEATEPASSWSSDMISRAVMQGLLLFTRHDNTVLSTIEQTGVFDSMFSASGKEAAHIILPIAEQLDILRHAHSHSDGVTSNTSHLESLMESLDAAVTLSAAGHAREAFLTAIALSMKMFLTPLIRLCKSTTEDPASTALRLMDTVQAYETVCPFSGLVLCSSLCLRFWQAMMGAITSTDDQIKRFFIHRLGPMADALALTNWKEASNVLQRLFWIPSIFAEEGCKVYEEVRKLQRTVN